ncbi:unnamed protein product, partial [marine sediment metagenome]
LIMKRVDELKKERKFQVMIKTERTRPLTVKRIVSQIFPLTAIQWVWNKLKRERKK